MAVNENRNLQRVMGDIYKIFSQYDKDNSESLEINELMNLLQSCKIQMSPEECEVIIQEMDSNNDGNLIGKSDAGSYSNDQMGVMDFGEFMTFLGMIFKIRFSRRTRVKEEFERKLKARSEKSATTAKGPKPKPPPRSVS